MTAQTRERLLAWARLPGPSRVLAAARRRLEAGRGTGGSPLRAALNDDEREQVGKLLGIRWSLSGRAVAMQRIEDALHQVGWDLRGLLEELDGPIRDRPRERAANRTAAAADRARAAQTLAAAGVPESSIRSWLAGRGLPKAGSGALARLAEQAAAVYRQLPDAQGTIPLPVLAATALHDPHALDRGSRLASTVLRLTVGEPVDDDPEGWRSAWESLGVVVDGMSSRVLAFNLGLAGDAAACRLAAAAGSEPLWLTWRSLLGDLRCTDQHVFVCENPAVVAAAADRLGQRCQPLVCTNGQPSHAARRLLARIAASGAQLHVRADDDPAGQRIVVLLSTLLPGAARWRYQRRDLATDWRPRYEEQDLELLLADLDCESGYSSLPSSSGASSQSSSR